MAIKMAMTIGLGAWGGKKLDEMMSLETPIWTIVLSLAGVALAIFIMIKDTAPPKA